MPLIGFKKRFVLAVEERQKRQTMRERRKRPTDPKVGDTLYLYAHLRTKQCRKLGEEKCTAVKSIVVTPDTIRLDGVMLHRDQREAFARADGFGSFDEMVDWLANEAGRSFPWSGIVIYW